MGRLKWQPPNLEQVKLLAAQGLTREQIAHSFGVCRDTIFERLKDNPDFADAIKEGAATGLRTVTNALYKAATDGNVTAMIFFLKSRSPESWADRQQLQHEHAGSVTVQQKETIAPEVLERMSLAFLKSRGRL